MNDARRLGGVTEKGEQVATAILDGAIETIADVGVADASLQRIADRAGVDKRVLRYYFGDREGLFAAVVGRVGDRLLAETEEALVDIVDPDVGFAVGFRVLWGTVLASPHLHGAYYELVAASITDPSLRRHVVAVRDRYDRMIQERARAAEAEGFVWNMSIEAMSALVIAGLQGLTLDYLQRGETKQLKAALREYQEWLKGLSSKFPDWGTL